MANSTQGLEVQLKGVLGETQAIAQQLYDADQNYLTILGKTARQQLILAAYQICTTQYPEEFLGLTLDQQQKLQQKIKALGQELQQHLEAILTVPVEAAPNSPDSFQDFVISSLFAGAKLSRKSGGRGRNDIYSKLIQAHSDDSDEGGGKGTGPKTLVVLSDDLSADELSETGLSPERLAEALANALESVIGDEQEKSDDVGDEDGNGDGDDGEDEIDSRSNTDDEASDSNNQDVVRDGPSTDETMPEITAEAMIDSDANLESQLESETSEKTPHSADTGGEHSQDADPQTSEVRPAAGDGDISSSFLGKYFAANGRSPHPFGNGIKQNDETEKDSPPYVSSLQTPSGLNTLGLETPSAPQGGNQDNNKDDNQKDDNQDEQPFDPAAENAPDGVMQWQRSRERLVLLGLQAFSHQTNQALRTSNAIPQPLPGAFMEGELALSRDLSLKTPNLVAMTAESTKRGPDRDRSNILKMVAVHLNLSDLELVNPELRRRSLQIRQLFQQLEGLTQRHQAIHQKLTIRKADQAWRRSWSDEI